MTEQEYLIVAAHLHTASRLGHWIPLWREAKKGGWPAPLVALAEERIDALMSKPALETPLCLTCRRRPAMRWAAGGHFARCEECGERALAEAIFGRSEAGRSEVG